MMRRWFQRVVLAKPGRSFVVLGISFFLFGAGTLNLGMLLVANLRLLSEHGWQALGDGGLQQLLELVATGYASAAAYVVFKACEHRLVDWWSNPT